MTLGPLMVDLEGYTLTSAERELLKHPLVGAVILFSRNYQDPAQLKALVSELHALRTPSLIVAVDHEGGRVQRFRNGFSLLPTARRIGHEYDVSLPRGRELAREMGWLMAAELRAVGVDLSFAPCVDLDFGVSEVIGDRAFHARGSVVAELAVAYMGGMREAGMVATAKHFPGHGAVVADSHHDIAIDRREQVDLEDDLRPYRLMMANGLAGVMMAHVIYPAEDKWPASASEYWIRTILREHLNFQGVVFADDLSMKGAAASGDIVERATRALAAGCDVLPVCNHRPSVELLLQSLTTSGDAASALRRIRLRGRKTFEPDALHSLDRWREAQALLAATQAAPSLTLGAPRG
jgi:beta-N-acetylhexosaminidase